MKLASSKIFLLIGIVFCMFSCGEEKFSDSIFDTNPPKRSSFDQWIFDQYILPYNVQVVYRYEDIETTDKYNVIPADLEKSKVLAQIVKHVWFASYDEVAGIGFTKSNVPRVLQFIGSGAYNPSGSYIVGTAEGGMKVTLYLVNSLKMDPEYLNQMYFHTMHHEFGHILHQKIAYDVAFKEITPAGYIGGDWEYDATGTDTDPRALVKGFITAYAQNIPDDDFVETYSIYVTSDTTKWKSLMTIAGENGRPIIERKLAIIRNYFLTEWKLDLDKMREVILRRSSEIQTMDYLPFDE